MLNNVLPPFYRMLRRRTGLSQKELAKRVDACRTSISQWENGKARPDPESEKKLIGLARITQDEIGEVLCEGIGEELKKEVSIGEELAGCRPSISVRQARLLAQHANGRAPKGLLRVFRNQIHAAEERGLSYDRAQTDLDDVAELVREEMEKNEP